MTVLQDLEAKILNTHNQIITVSRKLDELSEVEHLLGRASKGLSATADSSLQLTAAQRDLLVELRQVTKSVEDAISALRKADPERATERLSLIQRELDSLRVAMTAETGAREKLGAELAASLTEIAPRVEAVLQQQGSSITVAIGQLRVDTEKAVTTAVSGEAERTTAELLSLQKGYEEQFAKQQRTLAGLEGRLRWLGVISVLGLSVVLATQVYGFQLFR